MRSSVRAAGHTVARRRGPRVVVVAVTLIVISVALVLAVAAGSSADRWTPLGVPIGIFLIVALTRPLEPAPGEKFTLGAAVAFFAASVLPPAEAIALVTGAALTAKVVQRSSVLNAAVNVAIMAAATAGAAAIAATSPNGIQLARLVLAACAYAAVTLAGVGAMVVASRDPAAGLGFLRRESLPTATLVTVGAIAALLWTHDIIAILLLAIPLVAIDRGLRVAASERAAVAALSAATTAQAQFTEDVAHELRTPLTALIGELAYIGTDALDPTEADALASARRTAESLRALTERLLTFSRAGAVAGGATADLAAITRDVVARGAPRPMVELRLAAPPSLDVAGTPELLGAVVHDIVTNALAYTETGSVHVELIELHDRGVLVVKDTGIGIPSDDLGRIFDRFFRGARARSLAPGTGLGLAIARRIVEAHGGSLTVTSAPGAGTAVRVALPRPVREPLPATAPERSR